MSERVAVAVCPRTLCAHEPFRSRVVAKHPNARFNDSGQRLSGDALVEFARGAERVIVGVERIDAAIVERLPDLRVVGKFGVGLDNLDLDALEANDIRVGWTPGVNRRAVAEHVLAGTLALLRGLVEGDRQIRAGALAAGTWRAELGRQLSDLHVGIVGCGHVGLEVARVMRMLGARVSACDIRDRREWLEPLGAAQIDIGELCRSADVVTLHASLDARSRGLLNAERVASLKPGAIVVNTARGELLDEAALLAALDAGRIAGAFLDVLCQEPAAPGPLANHPRVLVSAHVGGSTDRSIAAMAEAAFCHLDAATSVVELRARLEAGRIEDG